VIPLHVLGAAVSAVVSVARASGAEGCPDTERLTELVGRLAGPSAGGASQAARTAVRVDFSRTEDGYQATLRFSGAREGERTLRDEGATCEALANAVAVTTALLLDASASPPTSDADSSDRSQRATVHPLDWWISSRLGAASGVVGGPTWLAGGAAEASIAGLGSFELGGHLSGSRKSDLGDGGVRVRLWYLELGAFRSLTGETARMGPCLLFAGGQIRGTAEGYPISSSASLTWLAVGAGVRGEVGLGASWRLGVRAIALLPTRKESLSVAYVGTPYQSSLAGGLAEVALSVKVW
jgi:hypothetical protein